MSLSFDKENILGEIPERPKGSDCKSAGSAFAGSNPALPTLMPIKIGMILFLPT